MTKERLQRQEQFFSKNYFLKMPRSNFKMHLKSAPQTLNFAMVKAASKTLDLHSQKLYTRF